MCRNIGSEPLEEEIPIEYDELSYEGQLAVVMFHYCPDNWEGMSGTYLGKRIECLPTLFDVYQVEKCDRKEVFELLKIMEQEFSTYIENKKKQQESISGKQRAQDKDNS